jgi:hypothetical protein
MEVGGQFHAPVALPPVSIVQEAAWASEPVSTLWNGEQSLAPAGNRTLAVQSAPRHYTDWAIPTSMVLC